MSLRYAPPIPPDFHLCSEAYGTHLTLVACRVAASNLPGGSTPVSFSLATEGHPVSFPISLEFGDCHISVEAAGPARPPSITVAPNRIRAMATWLIEQCVGGQSGLGGFATIDFSHLLDYVVEHQTDPDLGVHFPSSTAFTTITLSGPRSPGTPLGGPGDHDPVIPFLISQYLGGAAGMKMTTVNLPSLYQAAANLWDLCGVGMSRGGTSTWWQIFPKISNPKIDEMAYECDAKLGSPSTADCSKIEWNQLGAPSDTVTVVPGMTKYLHSNTCFVAISASISIVLNWEQIRTAVSTLVNKCIQHPIQPAKGGRAYYRSPNIRSRMKRAISGLNALPPHVNITIFQQNEPWTSPGNELKSCTWEAIGTGRPVSECGAA